MIVSDIQRSWGEGMENRMMMLLCVDGSENSDRAASFLARLAVCSNMKITLLHVVPEKEAIDHLDDNQEIRRSSIEHRIEFAVNALDDAGVDYIESVQIGDPDKVIVEMSNKYDGIIMGYKGHGMIETLFMGSVTEKVMRDSKKPVILIP
jgi:nucleotide-binding universal stress UspA family protein